MLQKQQNIIALSAGFDNSGNAANPRLKPREKPENRHAVFRLL
jgi:hypothetical protein